MNEKQHLKGVRRGPVSGRVPQPWFHPDDPPTTGRRAGLFAADGASNRHSWASATQALLCRCSGTGGPAHVLWPRCLGTVPAGLHLCGRAAKDRQQGTVLDDYEITKSARRLPLYKVTFSSEKAVVKRLGFQVQVC